MLSTASSYGSGGHCFLSSRLSFLAALLCLALLEPPHPSVTPTPLLLQEGQVHLPEALRPPTYMDVSFMVLGAFPSLSQGF